MKNKWTPSQWKNLLTSLEGKLKEDLFEGSCDIEKLSKQRCHPQTHEENRVHFKMYTLTKGEKRELCVNKINKVNKVNLVNGKCNVHTIIGGHKIKSKKLAHKISFEGLHSEKKKASLYNCPGVAFGVNKINKVNKVNLVNGKCNVHTIIGGHKIKSKKLAHKISFEGLHSEKKKASLYNCPGVAFGINKINKVNKVNFVNAKCNVHTIIGGIK